ncbi:MAG: ArsR/SmtB family transcription factor, partial [Longimicrobiales bacterium]
MPGPESAVFDRLSVLADATRGRLLLLLARHELTVGELCAAVQLPQSTVSRHLRILSEEGWLVSRAEGTSRYYRLAPGLDASRRRLWQVVAEEAGDTVEAAQDEARAGSVLARRQRKSEEFFATAAGRWDGMRAELFGERAELLALLGLLDQDAVVGDLGCGTGQLAAAYAPFVGRVIGVDRSREMLKAARRRLADVRNVELRRGELEALPLDDASLDVALLFLVLHYVPEPPAALAEAARVLRPGGRLLVVDMATHGREEYREQMGHV